MNKAVVIVSGGMDSTTLLYEVVKEYSSNNVEALSFNYGQRHTCELECIKKTCLKLRVSHHILNLDVLNQIAPSALTREDWVMPEGDYDKGNMKQTVVPNRNMVLLSLAAAFAIGKGITNLYYGAHGGDHELYPDCRKEFIDAMGGVLKLADWTPLLLKAPYWDLTKIDILARGIKLNVDYSLTHTCYNPDSEGRSCGKCGSCKERLEAFEKNGIIDPLPYY